MAAITLGMSVLESFADPAFMSCMPAILPQEKLDAAISLRSVVSQACQLLGSALGGVLLGILGSARTLCVDGALFLFSALPLLLLSLESASSRTGGGTAGYLSDLRAGLSYFFKNPMPLALCLIGVVFNVLVGPMGQMEAACVVEILHLDALALSVSGVACCVGMLAGSLLYPALCARVSVRSTFVCACLCAAAYYLTILLLGLLPFSALRYVLFFLINLVFSTAFSLFSVLVNVLFFKVIHREYLARVSSVFNAVTCLGTPLASLLGGTLAAALDMMRAYALCGALTAVLALVLSRISVLGRLEEFRSDASNVSVS